jgi:hypothetical protein
VLKVGDTFLLPPKVGVVEHLWIILTEADDKGEAVCANVTEFDADHTTELFPGEHPFFLKPISVMRYRDARSVNLNMIEMAFAGKIPLPGMVCKPHEPCSAALLQKVRDGLINSPHTPRKFKNRCAAEWAPKKS